MASDPGGENQIVMFKSCFPNSALQGNISDPVPPIATNPLKSQYGGAPAISGAATVAQVTYLYADGTTPLVRDYVLPAFSRSTLNVNDEAGAGKDVSLKVDSDVHIVAERPMYFNYQEKWTGGHDVIGYSP